MTAQRRVRQGDEIRHDWPNGDQTWHLVSHVRHYPGGRAKAVCLQHEETLDYGGTLPEDKVRTAHEVWDRTLAKLLRDPEDREA